jgi:WD40 repeat protein
MAASSTAGAADKGHSVNSIAFSPDSCYLAIACGSLLRVFHSPGQLKSIEPFRLYRKYKVAAKIKSIEWSNDSKFILSCLSNYSVVMNSLHHMEDY